MVSWSGALLLAGLALLAVGIGLCATVATASGPDTHETAARLQAGRWAPPAGEYAQARAAGHLSLEDVRALADRFWPEGERDMAVCVAWHESRFDPRAVGRTTPDYGLWQINRRHYDGTWHWFVWGLRFDPWANAVHARAVWRAAGDDWWPWMAAPICGRAGL